jgi:hypothetical protein
VRSAASIQLSSDYGMNTARIGLVHKSIARDESPSDVQQCTRSIMSLTAGACSVVPASVAKDAELSGRSWRVARQHKLRTC